MSEDCCVLIRPSEFLRATGEDLMIGKVSQFHLRVWHSHRVAPVFPELPRVPPPCTRVGFCCYKRQSADTCTHSWVATVKDKTTKLTILIMGGLVLVANKGFGCA